MFNIMKKTALWRGLAGLLIAIMMLVIFATLILFQYASIINSSFGISTSVIETLETEDEEVDTMYYKPILNGEELEINADDLKKVEDAAYEQTINEAEEGAVLLKNEMVGNTAALPLASNERKVSLFGYASYKSLYRTTAACTRADTSNTDLLVDLNSALTTAGFDVNQELFNAYGVGMARANFEGYAYNFEEKIDFYQAQQSTWANNYNDVAIVTLSRKAGEGNDMAVNQSTYNKNPSINFDPTVDVQNSLELQPREKDMLRFIKDQGFGKVIVLINSPFMMELDWMNDPQYDVDACLYVSTLGLKGFTGVANLLTGEATPSGKLVDTYAASSLSAPAMANAVGNTPKWANISEHNFGDKHPIVKDTAEDVSYVIVQQENIYVGYKYYETRYADAVMGVNGANSEVGKSATLDYDGGWDYAKEMVYPFGHGLSYTTFEQSIESVTKNEENNTYNVKVKVENTGSVAGKSVVQVYVNTPYGEYEKTNKIEKSAILFVGFEKTPEIQPGANNAVTVDVEIEEYLFASYDHTTTKGYVLTPGDYYFAIGSDAHDALNNVLGAKGYSNLVDQDGNAVTADADEVYKFDGSLAITTLDTTTYEYGEGEAGERIKVTNQFEKSDINYWDGNDVKYLTRSDWAGTFPTEAAKAYLTTEEMQKDLQGDWYSKTEDTPSTDKFAQGKKNNWKGVDNGLSFVTMKDAEYNDEVWNTFLDQFSLEELGLMTANYFGNKAIIGNSINLPEKGGGDGCQGVGDSPYDRSLSTFYKSGEADLWPCLYTSLLANSFNKELMAERGRLMANQALFLNDCVIWTGGGNLHRTPFSGRNAEYYSEDANLSYIIGSIELPAMEELGIMGGIKHFAGNDQETYRQGVSTFYLEQAFREGALRGFEGALRKGKVKSVMQAFSRQGVIYSSSSYELTTTVLRQEWGFKGQVITDASSGAKRGYKSHYTTSITVGTDIYCLDNNGYGGEQIVASIKANDDGYLLGWLRNASKNVAYALSRSAAVNGLSTNTIVREIMPTWQIGLLAGMIAVIVIAVASVVMFVISKIIACKNSGGAK